MREVFSSTREGMQGVDRKREAIDTALAGIESLKNGDFQFYIILDANENIIVMPEEAEHYESLIREGWSWKYPDLATAYDSKY